MICTDIKVTSFDSLTSSLFCSASSGGLLLLLLVGLIALGAVLGALRELKGNSTWLKFCSIFEALSKIAAAVLATLVFVVPLITATGPEAAWAAGALVLLVLFVAAVLTYMFLDFKRVNSATASASSHNVQLTQAPPLTDLASQADELNDKVKELCNLGKSHTNYDSKLSTVKDQAERLDADMKNYKRKYRDLMGVSF
jgi:hypothetical protein